MSARKSSRQVRRNGHGAIARRSTHTGRQRIGRRSAAGSNGRRVVASARSRLRQGLIEPVSPDEQWRGNQRIAHTWSASDQFIPRQVIRPILRLMELEVSGAVAMVVAATLALVWANSPWGDWYTAVWQAPVELGVGPFHVVHLTTREVVNDGLMTVFFLVVALEIKRELLFGALRDRRTAALPILAAAGGMAVPAVIYLLFNAGGPYSHGWGIPTATDIAFAVAVVSLAGPRVPVGARVFLLTLAIADDLGAILIIAIFYAGGLHWGWLAGAVTCLLVAVGLGRMKVRAMPAFIALGVIAWFCLHASGVHATITGVAFGFIAPAWSHLAPERYPPVARELVDRVDRSFADRILTHEEHLANHATLREISRLTRETQAPLDRIIFVLVKWSAFVIVPVFAFANAGVKVPRVTPAEWLTHPVVLGIGLGLVIGKTVGVFGAAIVSVRLGIGRLPAGVTLRHLLGVSVAAGVGFTVALFVASLSFTDPAVADMARLGILVGSTVAAVLGYLVLRADGPRRPGRLRPAGPGSAPADR